MSYEGFIARRYLKSGKAFLSVSTWISILGVALGVAAICVAISVHNGFENEIRSRLLGTTSHISVFPLTGELITDYDELIDSIETVDGVVAASPFIWFKAAISSASAGDGVIVRGIDLEQEKRTSQLGDDVTIGDLSFEPEVLVDDTVPGIIIGITLAEQLGVFLGEPVVLLLETGMYEYDAQMAYISLAQAQKLFKTGDAVTACHLKLEDIYTAKDIAPVIDSLLEFRYDVVPWNVLHKNLFSWIEIEKIVLGLGFLLIVIVAAFSVVSTIVMLTMEKKTEVGIMKTLGYTPQSIARIFVFMGLAISAIGVVTGWVIAGVVIFLQNEYSLISLPPDVYFISHLPFKANPLDFGLAGVVAIAVCFIASLYPALAASRLSVLEILRE